MKRPPSGAPGRRSALVRLALLGLAVAVAVAVVVLVVQPTPDTVRAWVDSDQVGFSAQQGELEILVEKDFKCAVPRGGEEDYDGFRASRW